MKLCECRQALDISSQHRQVECGDPLICPKCSGFLMCDFCKQESNIPNGLPIAYLIIGHSLVCHHHAWRATATEFRPQDPE